MPKTDPLTPARKIVALSVMMLLFLGSIGLAQLLVLRQRERKPLAHHSQTSQPPRFFTLTLKLPSLFKEAIPSKDPRVFTLRRALVDGQERELTIYFFNHSPAFKSEVEEARKLFEEVTQTAPTMAADADVAGYAGIELRAEEENMFSLFRSSVVGGRVIAILYTGTGVITDADEDLFAATSQDGVAIRAR